MVSNLLLSLTVCYVLVAFADCTVLILSVNGEPTSFQVPEPLLLTYTQHRLSTEFMLSLYGNLSRGVPLNEALGRPQHWNEVIYADTIKSFPTDAAYEWNHQQQLQQVIYRFNISQTDLKEDLRAAELRIKLPEIWNWTDQLFVLAIASKGNTLRYASSLPKLRTGIVASSDNVLLVDVTNAIKDWLEFARTKNLLDELMLDIALFNVHKQKTATVSKMRFLERLDSFYGTEENATLEKPSSEAFLVMYTNGNSLMGHSEYSLSIGRGDSVGDIDDTKYNFLIPKLKELLKPARAKRWSLPYERSNANEAPSTNGYCERADFEVSFDEMGWGDYIVYPLQFNAYQCVGKCGGFPDYRGNPTNHAVTRSLVRQVADARISPPCCAPSKLSPVSMIYMKDTKDSVVAISNFANMIVEECRCM